MTISNAGLVFDRTDNVQSSLIVRNNLKQTTFTFMDPDDNQKYVIRSTPGSGGRLDFLDNSGVSPTPRVDISIKRSTGNVGIGTVAPTEKLDVNGDVLVRGELFLDGDLSVGEGLGNDDDTIFFDEEADGQTLKWDNFDDRFEFSNELAFQAPILVGSNEFTPVGYSRITTLGDGSNISTHGLAAFSDLFIGASLEVDGPTWFDGQIIVAGGTQLLSGVVVTGEITGIGDLSVSGTKSSHVTTSSGERNLYALESPTVRFIDEGFSSLVDGTVRIDLEPIFMETIEGQLLIHVTPYGPTTLYVQEIGENYFIVESIDGGDVDFGWYVSAFRQGYSDIRLEETGQ